MKKTFQHSLLFTALVSLNATALTRVSDEASLQRAIYEANNNVHIHRIVFKPHAKIILSSPVVYTGSQPLTLQGNGAFIDGSNVGNFVFSDDLAAVTEDGSLVFNTSADITIRHLSVENSAPRGIVINIPEDARGDDIAISLERVSVLNSALYGVHIDDNVDAFDDGTAGSGLGLDMSISRSQFVGNGTGAIDFDGVRVDERGEGDIQAVITHTQIDGADHFLKDDEAHMTPMIDTVTGYVRRRITEQTR